MTGLGYGTDLGSKVMGRRDAGRRESPRIHHESTRGGLGGGTSGRGGWDGDGASPPETAGAAAADAGAGLATASVDADVPQIRGGLRVEWIQYRGAGKVKFAPSPAPVVDADGKPNLMGGTATTKVTFDKPGVYMLRAVATDGQGSMSIRDVKVTVKTP